MNEILTKGKTEVFTETPTGGEDLSSWFCVRTNPYSCPCGQFVADFITCAHVIIVWPSIDDVNLLQMCGVARDADRNPKVEQYKNEFGKCVSYYEIKSNPNIIPHVK